MTEAVQIVRTLLAAVVVTLGAMPGAQSKELCALMADSASGDVLVQRGDCERRVSPASTFKIAISLMGYDAGFLKDEHTPVLPFRPGYVDWRDNWREPADPARWIRDSVVWYSQQVTFAIGHERFADYTKRFGYGNADVSGLPATEGPDLAWINSSLQISPLEQASFLRKLVNHQLGVSAHAYDMTAKITRYGAVAGRWTLHGKTGSAGGNGLYVGWATREQKSVVFAYLFTREADDASGLAVALRARDKIISELPR
jgi:beta-lactamase class D